MAIVRIPISTINKLDIKNIKNGATGSEIKSAYKPTAFINLALYDMTTKENIVKLLDENIESGYLFADRGIGITVDNEPIWCSLADAKTKDTIKDYVSGAPVLVTESKLNIDWGNKVSTQIQGKHNRTAIGINDEELIMYVSEDSITLETLATRMIDYGCKYAINCDGGGSSHLYANGKTYKSSIRANPTWLLIHKKEEVQMAKTYTVVLDAGHGVDTPGKRSPDGKFLEYKFNRILVDKIANLLASVPEIVVVKTCDSDYDLSLSGRCKVANNVNADLFLSIHANASAKVDADDNSTWDSARGWECYICAKGGQAEKFANKLAQQTQNTLPNIKMRGVKVAKFTVLTDTNMPAVLVESGFMNNKEEVANLSDDQYQNNLALAYAKAAVEQLGLTLKTTTQPEKVSEFDWALTVLAANGVVTGEEYWKNNANKLQYLEQLIINMANYVEKNK